ncbi:DNA alkylation repair protein [Rothia sp. HSID18067]|uniref:DNA alkylation repair protein n=1 Tax=Rothia TaxID=32207 RepID=UPI000F86A0B6|nr:MULTISPECIES: DNA alkylation repair protein [Rothia]RUP74406.1 DNA alkylation repair protein [Rothia sp. HSID18067]
MSYSISQAVRDLAEPKLAEFTAKLLPTVDPARILGVRTPALRKLSQKLLREHPQETAEFLAAVPHDFQEEDLLHVLLLNEERNFATWHTEITSFLPYMTNWILTDAVSPACVKGRKAANLPQLERACLDWLVDDRVYVQRLGAVVLMSLLGTEYFSPEHLRAVAALAGSDEYYVRVAVAWYFAEALARQERAALPWFALADSSDGTDSPGLPAVALRMAITKAIESRRISDELKAELRQIRSTLPRRS